MNVADVKNILQNVDLTEEEVISQIVNLVQFQEVDRVHLSSLALSYYLKFD